MYLIRGVMQKRPDTVLYFSVLCSYRKGRRTLTNPNPTANPNPNAAPNPNPIHNDNTNHM